MNDDHIDLKIADYLSGRLESRDRRRIDEHLKTCASCRSTLAWAEEFRDEALREGLRHLAPMRVVHLAGKGTVPDDSETAHLKRCDDCRAELEWSRSTPEGEFGSGAARSYVPQHFGRWALAAAAVVIAVVTWMLVPGGGEEQTSIASLARLEPLPVHMVRSAPAPGSFEEHRLLGLEAYADGDYVKAREEFRRAVELDPDHSEMWLYLGSTALLLSEAEASISELERAADLAGPPRMQAEATWQLANAQLAGGRRADAERSLRLLADGGGHRAAEAGTILESLSTSD